MPMMVAINMPNITVLPIDWREPAPAPAQPISETIAEINRTRPARMLSSRRQCHRNRRLPGDGAGWIRGRDDRC